MRNQQLLEWCKTWIDAEQRFQEGLSARRGEGVKPQLRIVRLVVPAVLILGTVIDEQEKLGCRQALDQAVEQCLGL